MTDNLEDLLLTASDAPTAATLNAIVEALTTRTPLNEDVTGDLDFLLESWAETIADSDDKARFTLAVAKLSPADTPVFRNALNQALRRLLPGKHTRRGMLNHIGMRDEAVSIEEILKRCENLKKLEAGALLYDRSARQWLTIDEVDLFSFSVTLARVDNPVLTTNAQIAVILGDYLFFASDRVKTDIVRADRKTLPDSKTVIALLTSAAVTPLDDALCREILFHHLVPDVLAQNAFEEWFKNDEEAGEADDDETADRSPAQARGVEELRVILTKMSDSSNQVLDDEDYAKIISLMNGLSTNSTAKDLTRAMESLALVAAMSNDDELRARFGDVELRLPFLPPSPEGRPLRELEPWGKLKSGPIKELFRLVVATRGRDYAAALLVMLPAKCLNSAAEVVGIDNVVEKALSIKFPTAALLLWLWRNGGEAARQSDNVCVSSVIRSLAAECPKSWQPARRDLHKLLIGKADFQKFLLEKESDPRVLINALSDSRALNSSEQQSLMVKFSRHSPEFRSLLEQGEGKRVLAKSTPTDANADTDDQGPTLTSFRSYHERMRQLNEIINKKMPENTAAIAHARSYGDLRENAEYKAAKEEEGRLLRRRAELESDIMGAQPTRMGDADVGASAVIGSTVNVELEDGTREHYHLAGAWDLDPDRRIISYKTRLGQELIYKKAGDAVSLPDGGRCVVTGIEPLPKELVAELDDDDG